MSNQAHTIISGHSHTFDTGIAETLGLHAAIVFNHIVYWLKINCRKENANFYEGKYWMYETQKQMADFFGYLKEDDVWKAIKKLLDAGLLIKGNFNKSPFDKTGWYTTTDQEIFLGKKGIKEKFTKPLNSGIGDSQQRNPERPAAECNIQEDNQEDNQEDHHQKMIDDRFSKDEWAEIEKKYTKDQIKKAESLTIEKCACQKPESRRKYFRKVLESFKLEKNNMPSNENSETNRQEAFDFKAITGWYNLSIKETHVEDLTFRGKDISLNIHPKDFIFSLQNLFDSLKRREDSSDQQ